MNRIEQLLNGKFEYETPSLQLSQDVIEQTVPEGKLFKGDFVVSQPEGRKVRGFLYSSNPRVTFDPQEFFGSENRILYQVDTNGLKPGDETDGSFTFCTEIGESFLPYRIRIEEKNETSSADVPDLEELSALAQKDFQSVYPAFLSPEFRGMLRERHPELLPIYDAVKGDSPTYQSMEEFFIGCGLKEPVEISLSETEKRYANPEQSLRDTIRIQRSDWGFLRLDLTSDSRFLRLEKKVLTTDEFAGKVYELPFVVDTNFLHAGKNYARIKISTCYQELTFEVLVVRKVSSEERRQRRVQKMMRRKLENLYVDFRLKKIEMQLWIDRSVNVISSYKRAGGTDVYADLFLIQLFYVDDKRVRGQRLLEEIEKRPSRLDTPDRYAFYLYVTTFFQRDAEYVDQVEERVEQMLLQNRDNWVLQWILLYLKESLLQDDSAKLSAIGEQVRLGASSPILYLEGFLLLKKNPFLLRHLGSFEQKILTFGARQNQLTPELVHQVGELAVHDQTYSRRLFELLKACYAVDRSEEIVRAICTIAIAGDRRDPEFFYWYSLGVSLDLRITGLYEYYMETMDQQGVEQMPQIIRMYFIYNNTLDYHKKARIYRNISDNRDNIPQIYRSYRGAIKNFLVEQLGMGRVDENLAVLYERYLEKGQLTRALAERLARVLFTFEITCKNPNMKSVVVVHPRMKGEQIVPIADGSAQVQIYTEEARILLMDEHGNRYVSTSLYMAERMLDTPRLLEYCQEMVPEHPGLVLYMCSTVKEGEGITRETLPYFRRACAMETLKDAFREEARRLVLAYYAENPMEDGLFAFLKEIPYDLFIRADKNKLMSLLTQEGMYEEAFSLLETYGSEQVPLQHLVRICSQTVLSREYEENAVLLSYCHQCFAYGKYDDNILTYLLMYYDGPIEEMKRLWSTGRQFELDTMTLEEKILSLVLFTRSGTSGTEQIFASYQRKLGRRKLCRAYVILKSYEYFVKGLPVNDLVFDVIENNYRKGVELEDVCTLALLQYYSAKSTLSKEQEESVASLLADFNRRGMRFAFYQKFPLHLRLPYQLEDKVFLEVAADPAHSVLLHYRRRDLNEEFREERMKDCFEGINVKEFILFEGEEVECYTEELLDGEPVKRSDTRILRKTEGFGSGGRYELLNRILESQSAGEEEAVREGLENYFQLDYLTRELFTLI